MPDGDGGSGCEVASRGEAGWLPCCPPVVGKRGIEAGADGVMDRLLYFWPAEGIGWQRSRLIGKEGGSSGGGGKYPNGGPLASLVVGAIGHQNCGWHARSRYGRR